ncbi:hypothetical protein RND71_026630 [Anisodus tanguticus]|uniref:Uncharacterized protein n=1 Tax=Anisodus tanguticus TaxID=243964 RepID=A0AAE1RMN4_9SOLA|nr:hypothetical protein RND71_026630 [Anisodus tanguticus]
MKENGKKLGVQYVWSIHTILFFYFVLHETRVVSLVCATQVIDILIVLINSVKSSAVGARQEGDNVSRAVFRRGSWGQALSGATRSRVQQQPELACPLCQGHVEGWTVVEAARNFMNSITRSCALETCHVMLTLCGSLTGQDWSFKGTFGDASSEYQELSDDDSSEDDFLTELPLDGGLCALLNGYLEAEEGFDEDINISLDFELQGDFEDAFNESDDDSSEDDFLTELPLDGGLFDSEAEEELDEDINISLDFEFELSLFPE